MGHHDSFYPHPRPGKWCMVLHPSSVTQPIRILLRRGEDNWFSWSILNRSQWKTSVYQSLSWFIMVYHTFPVKKSSKNRRVNHRAAIFGTWLELLQRVARQSLGWWDTAKSTDSRETHGFPYLCCISLYNLVSSISHIHFIESPHLPWPTVCAKMLELLHWRRRRCDLVLPNPTWSDAAMLNHTKHHWAMPAVLRIRHAILQAQCTKPWDDGMMEITPVDL